MEKITYSQAKDAGLKRYFTGVPCNHGHTVERYVSTRACVRCAAKRAAKWQKDQGEGTPYREAARERSRAWHYKDPKARTAATREWRKNNPGRKQKAHKKRYHSDPLYRLSYDLRIRLWQALNGQRREGSAVRDLGCTLDELKEHLESQFQPGMNWENWGRRGWHIDHIRPLASFDLSDKRQLREACHFTNLQPLWWRDNLRKAAKDTTEPKGMEWASIAA